jgi:hypothetical protein
VAGGAEPKLAAFLTKAVWAREQGRHKSQAGKRYLECEDDGQEVHRADDGTRPQLSLGFATIRKCRIGGFWAGHMLAKRKLIDVRYKREPPCCGKQHRETLHHLLVRCTKWRRERKLFLSSVLRKVEALLDSRLSRAKGAEVVASLLGGQFEGSRLSDWAVPREGVQSELEEESSDSDVNADQEEPLLSPSALSKWRCLRVAAFFTRVMRARAPIVRALRASWHAQGHISSEGRSPNG